tara:strand:+ start:496 stop:1326 length:831 start_codon:yes stop_codon:yes gene_type:complete
MVMKNLDSAFKKIPWNLRINTFKSLYKAGSGHVGPCLSMAEILTCLFFKEMAINKSKDFSDRFILSKGHGVPILYSTYAELGLIKQDELNTLRQIDSRLQGHPDKVSLDILDSGSGALGQGLSIAIGYALAQNLKDTSYKTYCLLGDGEMQEGQIWEAIMYAGVKKVKNLCVLLDNNKFQNEVSVVDTLGKITFKDKLKSFGWNYISIDGHSLEEILNSLSDFRSSELPTFIDAHTIKGKGVDFMENNNAWHSKVLNQEDFKSAVSQCERKINEIN